MPKDKTLGMRMEEELYSRIEQYAAELTQRTGVEVSVTAAARLLLQRGLDAEQAKSRKVTRKKVPQR